MATICRIVLILLFFASAFLFPRIVYCHPVSINEFLADLPSGEDEDIGEWVELYNNSDNAIDLNGYVLQDKANNQLVISNDHTPNTLINPFSFIVIKRNNLSKFSLNNSSDQIFLFESTSSAFPIDEFSYDSTQTNKTWGKIPDCTGNWQPGLTPTPGQSNQPAPTPTSKPTPTSRPKSQSTPNPTQAPTSETIVHPSTPTTTLTPSTTISTSKPTYHLPAVLGVTQAVTASSISANTPTTPTATSSATLPKPSRPYFFFISSVFFFAAAFFANSR